VLVAVHRNPHWYMIELNLGAAADPAAKVKELHARCIHSQTKDSVKFACTHIPTLAHY
jgi:hypothetical protein